MLSALKDTLRVLRHAVGAGPQVDVFVSEKFDRFRQYHASPILDFGAGSGFFAKRLQDAGFAVTAVDVVNKSRYPEVAVQVMRGPELPFPAAAFATSLAHFVLHHIEGQDSAFAELVRVTKGHILVSEDVADSWWDQLFAWLHTFSSPWARAYGGFRTTRDWESFFARFPVDLVERHVIPRWRTPHYPVRRVVFVLRVRASS